ncbi:hypothetical protein Pan153_04200 [Gimesia panareensis]|uniref:Uncharacterized protein n=1 Tax=Gimesia panareensis TaxID=2527978 RepID=A0A518FHI4_9PLAN|nr:hypothetical protein Pan153_04200 [Gimesia panareensis]
MTFKYIQLSLKTAIFKKIDFALPAWAKVSELIASQPVRLQALDVTQRSSLLFRLSGVNGFTR